MHVPSAILINNFGPEFIVLLCKYFYKKNHYPEITIIVIHEARESGEPLISIQADLEDGVSINLKTPSCRSASCCLGCTSAGRTRFDKLTGHSGLNINGKFKLKGRPKQSPNSKHVASSPRESTCANAGLVRAYGHVQ
jgi:hypothetical protein